MQDTLKYLLLLLISSCVILPSVTTLQDSFELNEAVGQYHLCIPFNSTFLATAEMVTVQVAYQDMDAKGVCMAGFGSSGLLANEGPQCYWEAEYS